MSRGEKRRIGGAKFIFGDLGKLKLLRGRAVQR
jgi:hypothetical protein